MTRSWMVLPLLLGLCAPALAQETRTRDHSVTVTSKVPVLAGSQRSVAVQRIRGRGLVPSVEEEESTAPQGQVVRQAPSAGSEVAPGSSAMD